MKDCLLIDVMIKVLWSGLQATHIVIERAEPELTGVLGQDQMQATREPSHDPARTIGSDADDPGRRDER